MRGSRFESHISVYVGFKECPEGLADSYLMVDWILEAVESQQTPTKLHSLSLLVRAIMAATFRSILF